MKAMELSGLMALRDGLEDAATSAVADVCEQVRAESAGLCPVKSGRLRDSIALDVQANGGSVKGKVSASADYAAKVELGSYAQAPKPFLAPAFSLHAPSLAQTLARKLKELL